MGSQQDFKPFLIIYPSIFPTIGLLDLLWVTKSHSPASMDLTKFYSVSFPFFDIQMITFMPWFLLQGSHGKNKLLSHSWLGFVSQTKIWMFNISVLDRWHSWCHSSHELSINGLGPISQRKDIFDFTTLKGDYRLATSWCCMNTSKYPTFMGPNMFRDSACNGSLIYNLTKYSNLRGKNSYCILATGHHQCNLMENTKMF
jgi:hypothetical protein